jgi:hypothetical protein
MAETTTTTNMSLVLPTPGERLGPTWASDLNTALTLIDSHNHTSGKGVTLGVASFTIDADVNYNNNYALLNANYLGLDETATPGTDFPAASKPSILFSGGANGELYYNDGAGNQIPLTSGGTVNVPASAVAAKSFAANQTLVSVNPFNSTSTPALDEGDGYQVYFTNYSTGAAVITLPDISGWGTAKKGRVLTFKDINGNAATNPITIFAYGSTSTVSGTQTIDGIAAGGVTMVSAYESMSLIYIGDGTRWARI